VILRYRIVLHRGELATADIERLQAEYAGVAQANVEEGYTLQR
jgi:hypothetical protein